MQVSSTNSVDLDQAQLDLGQHFFPGFFRHSGGDDQGSR